MTIQDLFNVLVNVTPGTELRILHCGAVVSTGYWYYQTYQRELQVNKAVYNERKNVLVVSISKQEYEKLLDNQRKHRPHDSKRCK